MPNTNTTINTTTTTINTITTITTNTTINTFTINTNTSTTNNSCFPHHWTGYRLRTHNIIFCCVPTLPEDTRHEEEDNSGLARGHEKHQQLTLRPGSHDTPTN
ncbi:hypothetical protein Pmani_036878 [Petrolisthes manimaculis]|uniref:Uncharacterized protein n=1 Tax=Petrolisthes manimaculis TaxID=1843537 RepID=A0AAE1TM07_9EUCA|nr:hypothetical protein Pmani_036878 [Petrolisthes manimaculis]